MKINNVKVDILECVISGSYNNQEFKGCSYYNPISLADDLIYNEELKNVCITFNEIAELDKHINDMLLFRALAIKERGYGYFESYNNPLSPIEDYIHSVVNKDLRYIMCELDKLRSEKNDK